MAGCFLPPSPYIISLLLLRHDLSPALLPTLRLPPSQATFIWLSFFFSTLCMTFPLPPFLLPYSPNHDLSFPFRLWSSLIIGPVKGHLEDGPSSVEVSYTDPIHQMNKICPVERWKQWGASFVTDKGSWVVQFMEISLWSRNLNWKLIPVLYSLCIPTRLW